MKYGINLCVQVFIQKLNIHNVVANTPRHERGSNSQR